MYNEIIDQIFEQGYERGFEDMEVYISNKKELEMNVYNGEIDNYATSENGGISFRGIINGQMGYAYSEKIDKTCISFLVEEAFSNGEVIETKEEVFIFGGSDHYEEVKTYSDSIKQVTLEEKIQLLKDVEKHALDNNIYNVSTIQCGYEEVEAETIIKNTKGLSLENRSNVVIAFGYFSVEKDGDTKTSIGYRIVNDFNEMNPEDIAKEAIDKASGLIGAKPIDSNAYPVVFENKVFANLFSAFMGQFSGENIIKDLSQLKDKLGEEIGSDQLTVIDKPHLPFEMGTRAFDAEGVATKDNPLIEKGILKNFMHNLKTANVLKTESTGNASKGSFKGSIGISPSNLIIEPGDLSFEEVLKTIDKGVLITELQGIHSGVNSISGDFSLQCYGYEINQGVKGNPMNQMVVSGNFFQMIKEIELIANDSQFNMGTTSSPSVKITKLDLAGQ